MVHAVRLLKCKNGHVLPISYDSNECGCHHDGKPCIVINCIKCFEDALKNIENKNSDFDMTYIPLDKDGIEEIKKLLK